MFLLKKKEEENCRAILEEFDLSFAHADLRPYWSLLTELGAKYFGIIDLIAAIKSVGASPGTAMSQAPPPLNCESHLKMIYEEFARLMDHDTHTRDEIASLCIGLSVQEKLYPLGMLKRARKEEQDVFGFLSEKALFANELTAGSPVGRFIPEFGIENALELLADVPADRFLEAWGNDSWEPGNVCSYFAEHPDRERLQQPDLKERFRTIPMFLANEQFRPLCELSLPGNFSDPLSSDVLLVIEDLDDEVRGFLKSMGVEELHLATYVKSHLCHALQKEGVDAENRRRLVDVLAQGLDDLESDEDALAVLRDCPIVECADGEFVLFLGK